MTSTTLRPGTYWVGDPINILTEDEFNEVLAVMYPDGNPELPENHEVVDISRPPSMIIVSKTMYGYSGSYTTITDGPGTELLSGGPIIQVLGGLIAVIPVPDDLDEQSPLVGRGIVIRSDSELSVTYETDTGDIRVGTLTIFTGPDEEDRPVPTTPSTKEIAR